MEIQGTQKKKKKFKGPRIAKIVLKKNNEVGRLILFGFKTCYKATVIKTEILTTRKDIQIDERERRVQKPILTSMVN